MTKAVVASVISGRRAQEKIDALTAEVEKLREENDALRATLEQDDPAMFKAWQEDDEEHARLRREIRLLTAELAQAQSSSRVLAHCYDRDTRPPLDAVQYGRALPVRLPHCEGVTGTCPECKSPVTAHKMDCSTGRSK